MSEAHFDTVFGKIAVEQSLCTEDELKKCLEQLKTRDAKNATTLGQLMVDCNIVTKAQAERISTNIRESKGAAHQIPGYQILGKLGAGAMAIVYKAKQVSLDRTVAIKVLPKRFTENPDYVERFYKEGRAAAKLNHNNIVQAFDVGEAGGYHYFVMEYVEGKTLYDDLATGKVFKETEALDIIIQIANALLHAHARNLIHRDVKPKNIMINSSGVAKLADMGLARETTDIRAAQTEAGRAYGTPYYIAPEQIRGEVDIDGRADIYALGATFYHMVTGRVPFEAQNPSDVMRKHLKEALIPPDHINTSLSAGVSEVIEVMMAKNPSDRYARVQELLIDLNAIRSGEPPLQARKKFQVNALSQLQDGKTIVAAQPNEKVYAEDSIIRYRIIILGLGALSMVLIVVIFFLLTRH
ncbi:MAG: serine/threonine-protein kinase [Sedimentisphaerales bacterium]|nr:serine/threonine-protein kinase [Sedimentisphaerales bacterium]